jgi:hypothetical protein
MSCAALSIERTWSAVALRIGHGQIGEGTATTHKLVRRQLRLRPNPDGYTLLMVAAATTFGTVPLLLKRPNSTRNRKEGR